jgi:phosphoglycolate phosphatase
MEMLGVTAKECIYIGDSEVDAQFSINAGVPCIIVTWGFRDREELLCVNPDAIVDTVDELYDQIHQMGGNEE